MTEKEKIFVILLILLTLTVSELATFRHNAIRISDNKDTDLAGTSIVNGSIVIGNDSYNGFVCANKGILVMCPTGTISGTVRAK